MWINKYANWIVVFLLVLMFVLAVTSVKDDSATADEIPHIAAAYSYIKLGDSRLNPEHPPLIKYLAGLPLLFMKLNFPQDHPAWDNLEIYSQRIIGTQFLYHLGNNLDRILFFTRLPIILLMILLGFFIYRFSYKLFNKKTALLALFLYVFSPTVLAHGRYVTTDLGVTLFIFLAIICFLKFLKTPHWKSLLLSSITLTLALLSKFSALLLIPCFCLAVFLVFILSLARDSHSPYPFRRAFGYWISFFLIIIISLVLVGTIYWFHTLKTPLDIQHQVIDTYLAKGEINSLFHTWTNHPFLKPFAHYGVGLFSTISQISNSRPIPTFLLGNFSKEGFWYYFPIVFLLKTPMAVQILMILALAFLIRKLTIYSKGAISDRNWFFKKLWKHFFELGMLAFVIIYLLVSIQSKLNIGIRHLLPIFPFIFILVSNQTVAWLKQVKSKKRICLVALCLLLVWYAAANIQIYPHYLAYINEYVGGVKNGYKYLGDSNLDWGQDIKRLAMWVEKNDIKKIGVDCFGGGIPNEDIAKYYLGEKLALSNSYNYQGWLAVSINHLQWSKFFSKNKKQPFYSYLEDIKPIQRIGHSIFLYHISD